MQSLLAHLNNQHWCIKITMEMESSDSLPFTDVRFTHQTDRKLTREVYQSPTHTNHYVQLDSHQPVSVKLGIGECLVSCAIPVSSGEPACDAELNRIKQVMAANEYPKRFVEKALSRQLKRSMLQPSKTAPQNRSISERDSRHATITILLI